MNVRLVIVRGAKGKPTFHMRGPELVIGRQKGCGIRVPASAVSRQHCRLRLSKGSLFVEDLGSANGTRLNDVAVEAEIPVQPGDKLTVGPITFRVEYQLTTAARNKQPGIKGNDDFELVIEDEEPNNAHDEGTVNADLVVDDSDMPLPVSEEEDASQAAFLSMFSKDQHEPLDLPEGEDLRNLLSELEDNPQPKSKPHPKSSPKPKR